MPSVTGNGIDLSNLDSMILKIEKNLQRFVDTSMDAQIQVVDAFNKMGTQGVDKFIGQLSSAINKVLEIGKKGETLKWDSKNLDRYIDQVNKLIALVQQVQGSGFTLPTQNLNKEFASISKLKEDLKFVNELLNKGDKTGTDSNGNPIYRQLTKDEQNYFVEVKKNIQEQLKLQNQSIQERLNQVRQALKQELKETRETEAKKTQSRNQSYKGAVKYSDNAKTLEQERQAVKNLEAARERLKKTDSDYAVKLEELNNRINSHRISIEAATKTEAQRNALTSSTRAEYSRLLVEQDKLRQSYDNLKKSQATFGATPETTAALQNIVKRYRDVYAEILKYKQSANGQLDATERKFLAEQASMFAENEKRKTENARQEAAKRATITSTEANKVIANASGAKNLNQQIIAVQQLKDARARLDKTDADYAQTLKRLNDEIRKNQSEIDKVTGKQEKLGNSHRNLMDTAGQLERKLALVFSVSAIQGYMNKLIQIRGEFEMQHRSLQVLLQSRDEANKLWQQTIDLAIKSPFRVTELVKYTRQLAAYRIETEKLHDTTKRLADVSAGLGVDMSRIILAFGQVRAANFLRGTELRQFTEAGIPMLDELAKYFTELEGRAVSAGDVFERISKRMVAFSDVEEVFHRLTNAGGVFYRMQEEQSNTLKGMISNLHDSIDLMLNDIGKSNEGILKGSVNFAKAIIDNWRAVGVAIQAIIPLLSAYKLYQLSTRDSILQTAVAMNIVNNAGVKQLTMTQLLQVGWSKLATTMKTAASIMKMSIPLFAVGTIVSGIIELISAWNEHSKQLENIGKQYDEMRKNIESINVKFNLATDEKDIDTQKKSLNELVALANNDYNMNIKVNVEGMDAKEIADKFNEISQQMFDANVFAEHFAKQMQRATEWVVEDDIFEDLEQLGTKSNELMNELSLNRERIVFDLQKSQNDLNESQLKALELLSKPKNIDESEVEYLQRIKEAYSLLIDEYSAYKDALKNTKDSATAAKLNIELSKLQGTFKRLGIDANQIYNYLNKYDEVVDEAKSEFDAFVKTLDLDKNLTDEQKEIRLKTAIDKQAAEKGWNEFVTNYIYRWTGEPFNIKFNIQKTDVNVLEPWQKRINDAVSKLNEEIKTSIPNIPENMLFPLTKAGEQLEGYMNLAKGRIDDINTKFVDGQQITEDWEVQLLDALKAFIPAYQTILNIQEKTSKGQGKDWASEMVKGIKEAHQEYIKLNKTLDATEAKEMTLTKYQKIFSEAAQNAGISGVTLGQFNFETEQGAIDALEYLKDKLPATAKQARFKVEDAIGEIRGELRVTTKVEEDKALLDQIEDMFSGYELSLELEKLNIPPDLAKQLFNVDSLTLPQLKDQVNALAPKFVGTDMEEEYRKFLKKIDKMEEKAQVERLKKYTKYLVQAQSKRVKIKVDELQQLKEIEDTFQLTEDVAKSDTIGLSNAQWKQYKNLKVINKEELKRIGLTDKQIKNVLEYNEQMRISANLAKEGVKNEAKSETEKAIWEEFKGSMMYEQLFSDLEHLGTKSIDILLDKLNNMKDALKTLPPEVYKEIQTQISKLEDLKYDRKPFDSWIKAMKEIKELNLQPITITDNKGQQTTYKGEDALAYRLKMAEEEAEKARKNIELYQQIKKSNGDINRLKEVGIELTDEQKTLLGQVKELDRLIASEQKKEETAQDKAKSLGIDLEKYKKARAATQGIENATKQWGEAITGVLDGMDAVLDAFGVAEDDSARLWIESAKNIANMIMQVILLTVSLKAMGVAANSALGVIGWIATALQAVATIVASIFAAGDKKKERQIEKELNLVKQLGRAYDDLNRIVEKGYSIDFYRTSASRIDALKKQQEAYERMIEAERDKKNTDEDRINDWLDTIRDLNNEIEDAYDELREELVGDFKGYSDQLADAMIDALKAGEDGIEAWGQKVDEIIEDIVQKLLVAKFLEPKISELIDQYYADIMPKTSEAEKKRDEYEKLYNEYLENQEIYNTEGIFSDKGRKALSKMKQIEKDMAVAKKEYEEALKESEGEIPEIDKAATDNFEQGLIEAGEWFQSILPDWFKNRLEQGELSGLQRGIQGVTEETAQIIEAYLNSIRFFVAEQNTLLAQIASSFGNTEMENPMVSELRTQTELIRSIRDMFGSVIKQGHGTYGGAFLKVSL